ncbi:MAG TPA: SDR family oxidoreductase [Burkholderiales bacterium]|nr:SDR family oxidoreductase [Burkholderiales bacterium]
MNDTCELEGRVALITGAARNIGLAIAEELARAGATVVLNTRSSLQEAGAAAAKLRDAGHQAIVHAADVTDETAVRRMVDAITAELGRLDILVNNAVAHGSSPFMALTAEAWRRTLAVTLDGAFYCTQACIPHLKRAGGGSIVNMGGAFGHKASPGRSATSAAKAGLAGLTRALALEHAPDNINVNYVAPGPVNTVREVPARIDVASIPAGRFAEVDEVSAVVRMLCSPKGRYITGQTIHVNGGFYMNA